MQFNNPASTNKRNMTTLHFKKSISGSPLRLALLLTSLALACSALPERARAVSPAPDGNYPGGNTAEGQNALFSLTTGGYNAAVGWFSLKSLSTGNFNTVLALGRWSSTQLILIPQWALPRCC
jgi:hypothetical protein